MGWFKKNEEYRLYKELKKEYKGTYLLIDVDSYHNGNYDCICELLSEYDPDNPILTHTTCSDSYLITWGAGTNVKRIEWNELPENWRKAFMSFHFDFEPKEDPYSIKGLWKVENFERVSKKRMNLPNKVTLYCKSLNKMFKITHIAKTIEEANEYCRINKNEGIIAEDKNSKLIFIASVNEEKNINFWV